MTSPAEATGQGKRPAAPIILTSAFLCLPASPAFAAAAEPPPVQFEVTRDLEAPPPSMLDPAVRYMIQSAIESGDKKSIEAVLVVARKVSPQNAEPEIKAMESAWKVEVAKAEAHAEAERVRLLQRSDPFQNWKGELELGGYRSTGNTRDLGLLGSVKLERVGYQWNHKLYGRVELRRSNGETTTDRITASWQPSYKFNDRIYVYGLTQYERDPFAGYDSRYTLGGGVGYRPIDIGRFLLELEGGPAFRRTVNTDAPIQSRVVGRGSLNMRLQITPTLKLTNSTAFYLESGDSNASIVTALDTTVIGNLKARFSYDVQYESDTLPGGHNWNTQSRATFVYGF